MKRFLILSLSAVFFFADTWACFSERSTYNYYMFSVFRREAMNDRFTNQLDAYWQQYSNGEVTNYQWNGDRIMQIANDKGDKEMVAYLTQLNEYLEISDQLKETWSYPTKAELAQRKTNLQKMIQQSKSYKGTRLADQWLLLRMRANMVLGQNQENISLWNSEGSKLRKSVYRDMMQNIYAGALLRTGKRKQACDIYAEQGDMVSIKWAMRKHRNLAGIKNVYDEDPNSPILNFLIQDFVNNAQETMDSDEDWLSTIDARPIKRAEIADFIEFSNQVVRSGKTQSPALWKAAVGELQYLSGQQEAAMKSLEEAMKMNGTQRMKDNARAIRAIASVRGSKTDANYERFIVNEMKWLIAKIKEEGIQDSYSGNHYTDMLERLVYNNLVPKYYKENKVEVATALTAVMDNREKLYGLPETPEERSSWNPNYSWSEYYCNLDTLRAEELVRYFEWTGKSAKGEMEKFLKRQIVTNKDFFNDFIGTRYMAEGNFKQAMTYLKKVPFSFMEAQNISYYLAHRRYTTPRWFVKQAESEKGQTEGPFLATLTSNQKLLFCQDIIKKEEQFKRAKGEKREQLAYELATGYYQASYLGECWYLTHYGQSVNDTVRAGEMDFVSKAIDYLKVSKQSRNVQMRANSLYALSFIPLDPWIKEEYDYATHTWFNIPLRTSRQYLALDELSRFAAQHAKQMDGHITKCDVLKRFRKYN